MERPTSPHQNVLGQPVGASLSDWTPRPFPARETMQGRTCRLEPLDPARHADDLIAAFARDAEGRTWTYLPYGPFESADAHRAWLREISSQRDPQFYAIVDEATGRAIGQASYLRIDPANGAIEVGHLAFSPLLQQTTAATEAMYLMMAWVFDAGYRRYEWKCNALNLGSRRAAERYGFSFEGVFRQATVVKGRNRDTAWFAAIDREWPALKVAFDTWLDPANFDAGGNQRQRLAALTRPILVTSDPALL